MTPTVTPSKFGSIMRLSEATRDRVAVVIWFIVLASVYFGNDSGHPLLLTAGAMCLLSGAYSTFWLCSGRGHEPFVHGVPYVLALLGVVLLYFVPGFHGSIVAGPIFFAVTAIMHASVIRSVRNVYVETTEMVSASA